MTSKHLVHRLDPETSELKWYCGHTHGLRGGTWPEEWTTDKAKATELTQKQAKRLIDAQRHRKMTIGAEPSFTVVY